MGGRQENIRWDRTPVPFRLRTESESTICAAVCRPATPDGDAWSWGARAQQSNRWRLATHERGTRLDLRATKAGESFLHRSAGTSDRNEHNAIVPERTEVATFSYYVIIF